MYALLIQYCGDSTIKTSNAAPKTTSLIAGIISIGTAIFLIYIVLSFSSIGGYPNERRLLYALAEQTNNNQRFCSLFFREVQ
jgi:hypothetical protein